MKKSKSDINIFYYLQMKACADKLFGNVEHFEKNVRMWYAHKFHLLYQDTFKQPWPNILDLYYTDNIKDMDYNYVFELAKTEFCPHLVENEDMEDENFARQLEEEQAKKIAQKKKATPKTQNPQEPKTELPEVHKTFNMDEP